MAKRIEDVLPEVIVRPQRLSPSDLKLVRSKRGDGNRLGFAILLLHFSTHGRFPRAESELDPELFADVMAQLGIASMLLPLMVTDRTAERHRAEIRELLGFREATVADAEGLTEWLRDHAVADTRDICQLTALLEDRCRALQIEPPAPDRVERIVMDRSTFARICRSLQLHRERDRNPSMFLATELADEGVEGRCEEKTKTGHAQHPEQHRCT
jgi:hypothetical protein